MLPFPSKLSLSFLMKRLLSKKRKNKYDIKFVRNVFRRQANTIALSISEFCVSSPQSSPKSFSFCSVYTKDRGNLSSFCKHYSLHWISIRFSIEFIFRYIFQVFSLSSDFQLFFFWLLLFVCTSNFSFQHPELGRKKRNCLSMKKVFAFFCWNFMPFFVLASLSLGKVLTHR